MAAKIGESDQELDGVILRLEKVREEHDLSETAFAKHCGLAPNAYTKLRQRGVKHAIIIDLAKVVMRHQEKGRLSDWLKERKALRGT